VVRKIYTSGIAVTYIYNRNSKGKSGMFDHAELEETVPWRLRQRSQPKWQNIHVLDANLAIFGSPSLSQSLGYTFIEFFVFENVGFAVGILMISVILSDIYVLPVWTAILLFLVVRCLRNYSL